MKNQPIKATVKDGLPTAEQIIRGKIKEHSDSTVKIDVDNIPAFTHFLFVAIDAMQEYSDQQNAELGEQNRKNQSRWAKDRVAQDKKHESAMMEACGKIVDLEEKVKKLEGAIDTAIGLLKITSSPYAQDEEAIATAADILFESKNALKK